MPDRELFPANGELLPDDGSAIVIPDFLPDEVANDALAQLMTRTPWEERTLLMWGKQVKEPRLSTWHSDGVTYTYSGSLRTASPWTPLLDDLRGRCEDAARHSFNGVLVNLYRDGNDHLGWHADDELCNGPEPVIASVSLGAERRFEMRHLASGRTVTAVLPHGSLLVMSGLSQSCWHHRVPKMPKVTTPRVNLTFRRILEG